MEEFDLVDENGSVIGRAPRSACHGDPSLVHRAVHVFVVDSAGRMLLQKRSADKDIQPGKWDTSVGGHLGVGETYLDAATREAAEELGIEIRPEDLVHLHGYLWRTDVECELIETYRTTHEGPFEAQVAEIDDIGLFDGGQIEAKRVSGELTPNLEFELEKCRSGSPRVARGRRPAGSGP